MLYILLLAPNGAAACRRLAPTDRMVGEPPVLGWGSQPKQPLKSPRRSSQGRQPLTRTSPAATTGEGIFAKLDDAAIVGGRFNFLFIYCANLGFRLTLLLANKGKPFFTILKPY